MSESIKKVGKKSESVLNNHGQFKMDRLEDQTNDLEDKLKSLLSLTKERQVVLEDSLFFYQLIQVKNDAFFLFIF